MNGFQLLISDLSKKILHLFSSIYGVFLWSMAGATGHSGKRER
jgi:hypothetical protein